LKRLMHRLIKSRKSKLKLSIFILLLIALAGFLSYKEFHLLKPTIDEGLLNGEKGLITGVAETNPDPPDSNIPASTQDLSTQDQSYVLMDPQTNEILRASNPDLQRAPASTTKLLTGLVVLQNLQETELVRVGSEVNVEGSQLGLTPGSEITVHALLTALYVHSANDAAAALAVKTSGSIPAFAEEMNKYAAELGCNNSHFVNPHGLPDPEHYTTAHDLAIISNDFLKNESLMKYVNKARAQIQWTDTQGKLHKAEFQNTNRLLGVYPGDKGLKTGTTTEAGQCLVSYVSRADGELLLVLLGSKERYNDTIKLLDEGWTEQRPGAALREMAKDPQSLILGPGLF
jgi:D-alanyl-D-alanine carboxypeptidase (penicillin-binding protein 5/6)